MYMYQLDLISSDNSFLYVLVIFVRIFVINQIKHKTYKHCM